MRTDVKYMLVFGMMFVMQGGIGILLLRFSWRSWSSPQVTIERLYMRWQISLARKLFGEEHYRRWQAYIGRRSIQCLFATLVAVIGTSLLLIAIWNVYMIMSELFS